MRVLKITIALLLVLAVFFGVAVYVFVQTFDINRFREQIAGELGRTLQREVSLGKLELNVSPARGIILQVHGMTIKDDPYFSKTPFFRTENLQMEVDALAFFQRREIVVTSMRIRKPQISLIRDNGGTLNLPIPAGGPNVSSPAASDGDPVKAKGKTEKEKPSGQGKVPLPKLLMRSAVIEDGTLTWTDQAVDPAMNVSVSQLNLKVANFSLTDAFNFAVDAAVFSSQSNIHIKGKAQLDVLGARFAAGGIAINTDLGQMDVGALTKTLPQLEQAGLGEGLAGRVEILVNQFIAGAKGLETLSLDGQIEGGKVVLKSLSSPIEELKAVFGLNQNTLALTECSAKLGGGTVGVRGQIADYLQTQKYDLIVELQDIPLEKVLPPFHPEIRVAGLLNLKTNIAGQGLQPDDLLSNVNGESRLNVQQGKLLNVNILRMVLGRISLIPGLYDRVMAQIPEKYRDALERDDTVFQKFQADAILQSGTVSISRLELEADALAVTGRGSLDTRRQMVDLWATIYVPADLSDRIVNSVEELGGLREEDGRLKIPLQRYEGKLSDLTFMPDLEYIGKRIFVNRGKEELHKVLQKVLPQDREPPTKVPGREGQQQPAGTQASPEEQVIDNILDKIFSGETPQQ